MPKDLKRINKMKRWLELFSKDRRARFIDVGYAHINNGSCHDCAFYEYNNDLKLRCGKYAARILDIKEKEVVGKGCSAVFQVFEKYACKKNRTLKI